MSAEHFSYYKQTLHQPPSKDSYFQVDVENDWDLLAEAIIGSDSQPNVQLDQLATVLESHGVLVHRVPAPQPATPSVSRSPFITDPTTNGTTPNNASKETNPNVCPSFAPNTRQLSLFPQNLALACGTRVIEAPLSPPSENRHQPECIDALFRLLENAGAEVVRWPAASAYDDGKGTMLQGQLVDVEEVSEQADKEEEGPRFSPSDILILSPTLLVTRLSPYTNNKGLEYLWSVLSKPARETPMHRDQGFPTRPALHKPPIQGGGTATTLLVRITEPESPTVPSATNHLSPAISTRVLGAGSKGAPEGYTPLCRALVPIDGRIMLYDPALIAKNEARRLKSVLDRVQEGAGGGGGDAGGYFSGRGSKRDSVASYGTFGSLDQSDDEGWQFISVDGLNATSISFISPELALLSPASRPSASISPLTLSVPTTHTPLDEDPLTRVSQVLKTLGVRAVQLPFAHLVEQGGGVRDAILVLRRESNLNNSEDQQGEPEQQDEGWNVPGGLGDELQEGCLMGILASIATWLCGSSPGNGDSEVDG